MGSLSRCPPQDLILDEERKCVRRMSGFHACLDYNLPIYIYVCVCYIISIYVWVSIYGRSTTNQMIIGTMMTGWWFGT